MLLNCVYQKSLEFWAVLMDTWYATKEIMLQIEKFGKSYDCPLKDNRQVDDSGGSHPYRRVDSLEWSRAEQQQGLVIKIKGFPAPGESFPSRAVYPAHGLCRHKRSESS